LKGRVRLRHIQVFLTVAEEGNVTRASKRLNTAQPAVSRSLRELEEIVGCSLFERTSKGLVATKAGERFRPYAQSVISHLDEGLFSARDKGDIETVIVSAFTGVIRDILPSVVAKFKSLHPHIDLRLQIGTNVQLLNALKVGSVHLVIGRLSAPDAMQGLTFEHLWDEELVFSVSSDHPLVKFPHVTLEQIDQYEVVIPDLETGIRTELDRILLADGLGRFSNVIETISAEFAREYIAKHPAVFVFPRSAVARELLSGKITQLKVRAVSSKQPVGVAINPAAEKSIATNQFLLCLREAAKQHFS